MKDIQTDRQTHTHDDYRMPPGLRPPRHKYTINVTLSGTDESTITLIGVEGMPENRGEYSEGLHSC